jgi:hypothetical protein
MYAADRRGYALSGKESMIGEKHPMSESPVQVAAKDAGE